jgi:hypothetical protein
MLAQSIAVTTGAIAACENHPCSYVNLDNSDAEEAALKIVHSVFSEGGNGGSIFREIFNDGKEMEYMIKQVINESGSTCPSCTAITCKVAKIMKG